MLKIVKWLALLFGLFLGLVVLVGLFLPKEYHVERSVVIQADRAAVYRLVGDLRNWNRWSPWEAADPTFVTTLGDRVSGVGASQSWTGGSGGGSLTFIADSPTSGIVYDLVFDNGRYPGVGRIVYESLPEGKTRVTWRLDGENPGNPVGRYFGLLVDGLVGPMLEKGLTNLRREAETSNPAPVQTGMAKRPGEKPA